MKIIFSLALLIFSKFLLAQTQIIGPVPAQPGSTEQYDVVFEISPHPASIITWSIVGGTITDQQVNPFAPVWCKVEWDTDPQTPGILQIDEDLYGQTAVLQVMSAQTGPEIDPISQTINYGSDPLEINVTFVITPNTVSYQWQKWTGVSWNNLVGETFATFQPPTAEESSLYRCVVEADANIYYLESSVTIPLFNCGSIQLTNPTQPVNYNTVPLISTIAPSGGYCLSSNYIYTWEYSIENGPWIVIGNTQEFPSNAPAIVGKTNIRRRVSCGSEEQSCNELVITPAYTSVDFENRNYLREITVLKKGILSWQQADALSVDHKIQGTLYFDGLGRPIQGVEKSVSASINNSWKDIVKHFEYDVAGRQTKDFLDYATSSNTGKFKTDAAAAQQAYIQSFYSEPSTSPTYHLTNYDNSPLARILKVMDPGQSWAGSNIGVSGEYDFNTQSENVHIWSLDYTSTAIPVTSTTTVYQTGKLAKFVNYDEKNNKVITYYDESGNVILKKVQSEATVTTEHDKWLCTYFVYDDFGKLRFLIPPKAIKYLDNSGWNLTSDIVDELCYLYRYDEKGRMISKKAPGVGEQVMVYDKKDRLVLTQDAVQKTSYQWSFNLYDDLNRIIATGFFTSSTVHSQSAMQTHVNGLNNGLVNLEIFVRPRSGLELITADNPVAGSTGTNNYCNGCLSSSVLYNTINYYDKYDYGFAFDFNTNYTFSYSSSDPNIEATVKTNRTSGFVTGQKIRILDDQNDPYNVNFLCSTVYYDEAGRQLQVTDENNSLQADILTNQYDFTGKVMSTHTTHNYYEPITIIAKHEFDKLGRLTRLSKNFNSTTYKQLAEYSYDELGNLKTKRLAPGYGGTEIEKLTYDYNIHGRLTGINKDYALSDNNYSQWDKYFGLYIGYDNSDARFNDAQYNGSITGVIWKSQGDNSPRKYDFTYDKVDRFTSAIFKQKNRPADSWSNAEVDFSTYVEFEDGNGNIKSMKHYGILPGLGNGILVDHLQYVYKAVTGTSGALQSNKLIHVTDNGGLGQNNGLLSDFKDGNNGSSDDYEYDVNGNLVKDLNKNIVNGSQNGIIYNHLNKPVKIIIPGKSTIEFVYEATGEKLQKKVTYNDNSIRVVTYVGDFVYEQFTPASGSTTPDILQFILHEEGRIKIITPHTATNIIDYDLNAGIYGITWPGGKQGVFEYFIKDHLGSTRLVLTEEVQKEYYKATMEQSAANVEEPLFGQVPASGIPDNQNELRRTRYVNTVPASTPWPGNTTDFVKLNATDPNVNRRVGPNMILKVMAGDIISSKVDYYYYNNDDQGPQGNPLNDVVSSIISAIVSPGKGNVIGKAQSTAIGNTLNNNSALSQFIGTQNTGGTGLPPRAYLNIVFLDEQFKFIEPDIVTPTIGSGSVRVDQANNPAAYKILEKKAPKNGWVFVYVSNQSNENVYFDNFIVTQEHSRISEENHYYPFGQKIAGISSKAFNKLENNHNFQGEHTEDEVETGWVEFRLRTYDPQIGRWINADPEDVGFSPYIGMGNNPFNMIDADGADPDPIYYMHWYKNIIYKDFRYHSFDEFMKMAGNENYIYIGTTLKGSGLRFSIFTGGYKVHHVRQGYRAFDHAKDAVYYNVIGDYTEQATGSILTFTSKAQRSGLRETVSKIPVVNAVVSGIENAAKGNFAKAILNLGEAAFDIYSMGGSSLVKLGIKETFKRVLRETGENYLQEHIGFSPRVFQKGFANGITHGHHPWPKFLGGPAAQDLAAMGRRAHQQLHRDLNNFLKEVKKKTGLNMVPSSKNTTADISAIPINVRKKTVRNFYKKYKDKYKKAADLFNEQF